MTAATVPQPIALTRAVEDLRNTHDALTMAASGIAAELHHESRSTGSGVYYLLMAVAEQMDVRIKALELLAVGT